MVVDKKRDPCHYTWQARQLTSLTKDELVQALCLSLDVVDFLEERIAAFNADTTKLFDRWHSGDLQLEDIE